MIGNLSFLLAKEKEKYRNNEPLITLIKTILKDLQSTEILPLLRLQGRAQIYISDNPIENAALSGARSEGYNECLDHLENFLDFFVYDDPRNTNKPPPTVTYGGLKKALIKGDITQDEYDTRRSGLE